jgi:hypothetical protein
MYQFLSKVAGLIVRCVRAPLDLLDHLVEERKLVRRALVLWAAGLITFVTLEVVDVLGKMSEITAPVTSFYLGVTGLLTAVIGFYQWSRERDDAGKNSPDRED